MGVDTQGFTTAKNINQVLKALDKLGYEVNKDNIKMSPSSTVDFYMIPFKGLGETRTLSFGTYMSATNGLADVLPKKGRKLKNAKMFSQIGLGASNLAYKHIQGLVGALGGGYIQFKDTSAAPAVEIDEKGSIVRHNKMIEKNFPAKVMQEFIYFDKKGFLDLPKGEIENVFINNDQSNFKPCLVYRESYYYSHLLFLGKDKKLYFKTIIDNHEHDLNRVALKYANQKNILMNLQDLVF